MLIQTLEETMAKAQKHERVTRATKFGSAFKNITTDKNLQDEIIMRKKIDEYTQKGYRSFDKIEPKEEIIVENPNEIVVNIDISNKNSFEEQKDKNLMLNKFMVKFTKAQNSIISDLFYAMNCTSNKCNNCQIIFYNYQIYFFLLFPLEEVRKFKLMNNNGFINNNFNPNNNIIDIYDCFNYDMRINLMSGNKHCINER